MSDTEPTTAEQVVTEYLSSILSASTLAPTIARQLVSVLRSSPAALADLNGGEWGRLVNAAEVVAEHHDIALAEGAYDDGINPDVIAALDALGQAVAPFVPREDPR